MTVIYSCAHCSAQWKGKDTDNKLYCKDCGTSEKRKEMDKNNEELFAKHNLIFKPK